jgi:hypothetical protein
MTVCGRRDRPGNGRILRQRQMSAGMFVICDVRGQDSAQPRFSHDDDVIENSRRSEPIHNSTYAFCHSDCGAVSTSVIPIPLAVAPYRRDREAGTAAPSLDAVQRVKEKPLMRERHHASIRELENFSVP